MKQKDILEKLYDYQKMLLQNFVNNKYCITLSSRQSGKCLKNDVEIVIKDKESGEEFTIPIGEFFNIVK